MNRRYQIFISSTVKDLEKERTLLTQTVLRKGYYPAGMEWFPGIDEEQFDYIKQVIDDSDYYVILLGGLYGTITSDGKSYTEKEYDYAIKKGKKSFRWFKEILSLQKKMMREKSNLHNFIKKLQVIDLLVFGIVEMN